MEHESLVIILAAGGSPLEGDALDAMAATRVTWSRMEREGNSACLAARVRHLDRPEEFRLRIRAWGATRGWAVTVAPCGPTR